MILNRNWESRGRLKQRRKGSIPLKLESSFFWKILANQRAYERLIAPVFFKESKGRLPPSVPCGLPTKN